MSRTWTALRWVFLPWWLLQLFTAEKSFHPNPILGSLTLNRRGLFILRARLAHRLTHWRRNRLAGLISDDDRRAFERDGYVLKSNFLSKELFRDLISEVEAFAGRGGEFKEGDAITRRIPLTAEALTSLPACRQLLRLPEWRGLTRYVSSFDSDPLVFIQSIFTQVDEGQIDPQTSMHIDTFHPTMKAWLFLRDVVEEDGPLSYVPGSHIRSKRREVWERRMSIRASDPRTAKKGGSFRISKPEMRRLRSAKLKRFNAPANTLVVGDTYGFHARRRSAGPSSRIEIWAYSRRNPFTPWTRFDLAALPIVRSWLTGLGWWFLELHQKHSGPTSMFRQVAGVSPYASPQPWRKQGPKR